MVSLKNILTHILQANGFEVFEKDGIIYGQKGDDIVTIGIYDKVSVNEIKAHRRKVEASGGRNIICVLEAGTSAEQEANDAGLILWRRADLEKEIGKALDVHISRLGGTAFGALISPTRDADTAASALTIDALGTEGTPKVLKCKLSRDDVNEISKKTIQGFKFDLELVPYYVFQYTCKYEGMGGRDITVTGIVSVNALTGKCASWDRLPEVEEGPVDNIQMEPKIDEENARKMAVQTIIAINTEFKDIIVERDHATIMEKATFGPQESSILVLASTFVMVPVWCVEGKHGVMILDGMSGKIISEDYYDKR